MVPENQIIVSNITKKIQNLISWQVCRYRIMSTNDAIYEIFSLENMKNYIVKLKYMTCTYFQWQSTGIPSSHAIGAILARQENPQTYIQAFQSLDAYYRTMYFRQSLENKKGEPISE